MRENQRKGLWSYFCKPFLAGALAAAGRAYVHGSEAVARGGKVASDMYERHGVGILEKAGMVKDFVSGYGMPLSMPTNRAEGIGTGLGLLEAHEPAIRRSIDMFGRAWDEAEHPRNPKSGEFSHK